MNLLRLTVAAALAVAAAGCFAGMYTPLVADSERVYIVGYSRIHALDPTG